MQDCFFFFLTWVLIDKIRGDADDSPDIPIFKEMRLVLL
jgi:hypothetical protein